jgi:competence protein ComEA
MVSNGLKSADRSLRSVREWAVNEIVQAPSKFMAISLATLAFCLACDNSPVLASQASSPQPPSIKSKPIPPPEARIDLNHASVDELLKIPGMTSSWAGRIVRFRPYRTKLDLVDRGVLPSDVYDRIKDYVIAHRDKQ